MENDTKTDFQSVEKKEKSNFDVNNCPMTASMKVIGGKWKLILLNYIYLNTPARFGELKRKMKGITQTMLTSQLRELERDGIIERKIYAEIPPKVEYTLTPFGHTLQPVVASLCAWGTEYLLDKKVAGQPAKA